MTRLALVVGGASGIGAASAEALAANGVTVVVADLNLEKAASIAAGLEGEGHFGHAVDVCDEISVAALFDTVERASGPIAILVVAAGVSGFINNARPTIKTITIESWDHVMAVNARGPFLCLREIFRRRAVMPVDNGRVILVASMAAQMLARNGPPSYVTSKGAVLSLTKVAAGEASEHGMTVNAVAPGAIDTPMLRGVMSPDKDADYFGKSIAERAGRPSEVAAAIAFLATPEAAYINGACIDINGGMLMR
ncbi:SDR family NAD(P)-dependent oxidoreductase [Sphingomonas sp. SRS2]|uniref:SDR family NAD(P)-dependent oxidoreductase n=1 Tax=Sphingomonas sp. SRS2 TaxID=133190 RepID=UPI0006184A28|nr:SDR family oxidoreductase [Sphingomonas sp. SRS2]KKC25437.1 hypothetical protein WP12_14465 [Sphingomonas sp. SRS2]